MNAGRQSAGLSQDHFPDCDPVSSNDRQLLFFMSFAVLRTLITKDSAIAAGPLAILRRMAVGTGIPILETFSGEMLPAP
jgi:hypothetical protein